MLGDWQAFSGWCVSAGIHDPYELTPLIAVAAYRHLVLTHGSDRAKAEFEAYIEPPNAVNPMTGVPDWYGSDEEAWETFKEALKD